MEIYLSKLNQLEDQAASSAAESDVQNLQAEQGVLEDEFKGFLEANKVYAVMDALSLFVTLFYV